jgi:hypothetical protein
MYVVPRIHQSQSMAKYGSRLRGEHATHLVGLQLGENLPEGLVSATAKFNTSEMYTIENAIPKTYEEAIWLGAKVETKTVAKVEYMVSAGKEVPVLVGIEREA